MKIIVIGDIHGRESWKELVDIDKMLVEKDYAPKYDKYIFLGDYVDAYTRDNESNTISNLIEIIELKKKYPDDVILLWGNHDNQYHLDSPQTICTNYGCSGYRSAMHFDLYDIFTKNKDLFQMAYQHKNHLFTHAGVHRGWYEFRAEKDLEEIARQEKHKYDGIDGMFDIIPYETLADKLNLAFERKLDCIFDVGWIRGGDQDVGGPFWLDKRNADKPLEGLHQYVGHTKVKDFITNKIDENTSITFCDVLQFKVDY
ncbi:MAG: metallophosphoesterase, partial [Bacteroidetes bacterium]|nr:metallophosphoesterase [Bacteroidota bacterium]